MQLERATKSRADDAVVIDAPTIVRAVSVPFGAFYEFTRLRPAAATRFESSTHPFRTQNQSAAAAASDRSRSHRGRRGTSSLAAAEARLRRCPPAAALIVLKDAQNIFGYQRFGYWYLPEIKN